MVFQNVHDFRKEKLISFNIFDFSSSGTLCYDLLMKLAELFSYLNVKCELLKIAAV